MPAGHTIEASDLTTAQMAGNDIPAYAGNHMDEVIGKIAAVGLVKGEILNQAMVSTSAATPTGYVVAGVLLKPGQLPAGGVSAGDKVMVILLTGSRLAARRRGRVACDGAGELGTGVRVGRVVGRDEHRGVAADPEG